MKQLIEMDEGVLVEVDVEQPVATRASAGGVVQVDRRITDVMATLSAVVRPFASVWNELSREVEMNEATVSLSLGITGGGNFFIAKGETSANLEVELKFKPKPAR